MAGKSIPITGLPAPDKQNPPPRKELTAWYNDPANDYQVSLFMHGMQKFKELPIEDPMSFFQIAGIHSYPLVGWDGDPPAPTPDPGEVPGYCHHNKVTFPLWHRPYMLLYEQGIWDQMKIVLDEWKQDSTVLPPEDCAPWDQALEEWRLPYWDWASAQSYLGDFGLPQICTLQKVKVKKPSHFAIEKVDFPNPLTGFTNPKKENGKPVRMGDPAMEKNKINPNGPLPWDRCIGVSRYGIQKELPETAWENGVNNWMNANISVARPPWYWKKGGSFSDAVSRLLSPNYFSSYEEFASTKHNNSKTDPQPKGYLSLEYIHNIIHNAVGGQWMTIDDPQLNDPKNPQPSQPIGLGHMSDVPVAAFDPIFWFHHCNIDRLCAMWQALNWDMWFDDPSKGDNTPTEDLTPFHYDTERHYWNGNKVRDVKDLGYTYDDLVVKPDQRNPDGSVNMEKYLADLRTAINTKYPGADQQANQNAVLDFGPDNDKSSGEFDDYFINVTYDRYALEGKAYSLLFFLGEPPKGYDLVNYTQQPGYLGQVFTFSSPVELKGEVTCANCAAQRDTKVLSKAQIPITVPLMTTATYVGKTVDAGKTVGFLEPVGSGFLDPGDPQFQRPDPEAVEKLLEVQLRMLFVELGGNIRPATDFPDTQVKVMHGKGVYVDDDAVLPIYKSVYSELQKAGATSENITALRSIAAGSS